MMTYVKDEGLNNSCCGNAEEFWGQKENGDL